MRIGTLCYLIDQKNNKVLLGVKKYGAAKGRLNGFGGKLEPTDESIEAAIRREFFEETSIVLEDPKLSGLIQFNFSHQEPLAVYLYLAHQWQGQPTESKEMTTAWYDQDKIPLKQMWSADRFWFPTFNRHKNIIAQMYFKKNKQLPYKLNFLFNQNLYEGIHETFE